MATRKASNIHPRPRVCVIGAGISGMTAARYLQDEGITFTVLEATDYVGGTWRYDPRVGTDEYGQPIYSSMFKNLRTNLPKQTMQLTDFPIPDEMPTYPSWKTYYEYIKSYSKHFGLEKHIKFHHSVASVKRINNIWSVIYKNLASNEQITEYFDFVIVSTGHNSKPNMPKLPGQDKFIGSQKHSHDYKVPEPYANHRVLVIGGGPSAFDIGLELAEISTKLVHSHHIPVKFPTKLPPNFIVKPDVKAFNDTGAIFMDGTYEELDDIVYCTGYEYYYPFLDESSEMTLGSAYVAPLYKYMVNIHQPSMIMMGLVAKACIVAAIDAQARYVTALVKGNFTLPSQDKMFEELQNRVSAIKSAGRKMKHIHVVGDNEKQYYEDLAKESGTLPTPPVLYKIRTFEVKTVIKDIYTFRNYEYTVIDNETFEWKYVEPKVSRKLRFLA